MTESTMSKDWLRPLFLRIRNNYTPLQKFRRIGVVRTTLLPLLDRPLSVRLHNVDWPVRVRLVRHMTLIVDSRILEPSICALFQTLCRRYRIETFWDIGAHIGYYSWLVMGYLPNAETWLFEADPQNADLIQQTISRNNLSRASLQRLAVSDRVGFADFKRDTIMGLTGSLRTDVRGDVAELYDVDEPSITVPTNSVDRLTETCAAPDLMKIDVEGAEDQVFAGAKTTLREHQPLLIFETLTANKPLLLEQLRALDYRICGADQPGLDPDPDRGRLTNCFALPQRFHSDWQAIMADWQTAYEDWRPRS